MSLTKCTVDTDVISNLADEPTLTAAQLKAKFDKEADDLKTYLNSTLTTEVDSLVSTTRTEIINTIEAYILQKDQEKYHIGKIIMSTEDVNPATYLGFGTWTLWGSGRVPVGINTSDTDFSTSEKTGGAKTHTLTAAQIPSHTHTYTKANSPTGSTALTINQIPSHNHDIPTYAESGSATVRRVRGTENAKLVANASGGTGSRGGSQGHTHTISGSSANTGSIGSGTAHNNLQPYITCYMWKRVS